MISKELVSQLRPLGYYVKNVQETKHDKYTEFQLSMIGINNNSDIVTCTLSFVMPTLDSVYNRVFEVQSANGSRTRVLTYVATLDPTDLTCTKLLFRQPTATFFLSLEKIIANSLLNFHYGKGLPSETTVSEKLQTWLNTSRYILDVDLKNQLKINSVLNTVFIDVQNEFMSHNSRLFKDQYFGILDPTSTPTSDKINQIYRLSDGCKFNGSIPIPSTETFCKTIVDNGLEVNLNPRRLYLLRTTFENSSELVNPEKPIVSSKTSVLHGVNLNTAIMHFGVYTYEDALAISESAAKKFNCNVYKTLTFKTHENITLDVKEGDIVSKNQLIAHTPSGTKFLAKKIFQVSAIESLQLYETIHHGRKYNILKIVLHSVYLLENGDKLSNRGACKGIVSILPDSIMPVDQHGNRIDICVSPESVYGRRIMSIYWEMMASSAIRNGVKVEAKYKNSTPSFKELVELGYGDPTQLYVNGEQLTNLTFVGNMFWLRLNKYAVEMLNSIGKVRNKKSLIDDAKVSGQRIDLAKSIALFDRGLYSQVESIIDFNMYHDDLTKIKYYVHSLATNEGPVPQLAEGLPLEGKSCQFESDSAHQI